MNVGVIFWTALITTLGLILITEFMGKRSARSVNKILGLLGIAPVLSITLNLLLALVKNPNDTNAASSAADKMINMLPETILSAIIGDVVGIGLWGIYRWIKRFF